MKKNITLSSTDLRNDGSFSLRVLPGVTRMFGGGFEGGSFVGGDVHGGLTAVGVAGSGTRCQGVFGAGRQGGFEPQPFV